MLFLSLSLSSPLQTVSSMAALFSPPFHIPNLSPSSCQKPIFSYRLPLVLRLKNPTSLLSVLKSSPDSGVSTLDSAAASVEPNVVRNEPKLPDPVPEEEEESLFGPNWSAGAEEVVIKFEDPKWVGGTWDLNQFQKNGGSETDWDAVIDAEARRRKWLATNPETSSNDDPIIFDTSIIPWWAWIKRYHLPEAELLNGRAAMIGFFMAYVVDSLTGVGLVDQMGNFLCKTLLFVAVVGVLLVRKNEDLDTLKKLLDETTFYDKQWQATWQDVETPTKSTSKNE